MEESDLLKERVQAITGKHRIQELIRLKKLELDFEKLKLQHLKKKALREHWLLQDSAYHNAAEYQEQRNLLCDQLQTRALQLNIHSIEMEILSLEREETRISINESLILNRLKALEKSPEEIIREAQVNFVAEPLQTTTIRPESTNAHSELNTPRKNLFAMEINMTKNLPTGKCKVLSTAAVPTEELNEHTGQIYDECRKCVYALNSQQSHDMSCISKLSANEVEQLLISATVHRQVEHHQNPCRLGHYLCKHQDHSDSVDGCDTTNHTGQYDNYVLSNNTAEKDSSCRENWQGQQQDEHQYDNQEHHFSKQEEKNDHNSMWEGHHFGNHKGERLQYGNQTNNHYSSYLVEKCHSAQESFSASHNNGFISSKRRGNGGRPIGYPSPNPHPQEAVAAYQPQLGDYISADEEECFCYSPPSQTEDSNNQSTALYHSPIAPGTFPSPLYREDSPYTILNTLDTTEPITAIFMGFQAAHDDSGQNQEFVGSLKAELVIIDDNEENGENNDVKTKPSHTQPGTSSYSTKSAASGNLGYVEGLVDRQTERQTAPGIRRIKKHKPCCSVC